MKIIKRNYPAVLMIIIAVIVWESYVKITEIERYILPAPTQIFRALVAEWSVIFPHAIVTFYEALLGFGAAVLVSLILGLIIDSSSFFKRGFYPILVTSQTIPIIAIAPLFIVWFGFGLLPKVIVVALVAFFPIVINLIDGLNSADHGLVTLLKTMNASKWQILTKIRLPGALPAFFSGLRIAATYSVMGAVIGEWFGASKGLGLYIKNASNSYLIERFFAASIVIVATSILFYGGLLLLESVIIPWSKKNDEENA